MLGFNLATNEDFTGQDGYANLMLTSRPRGSYVAPWDMSPAPMRWGAVVWTDGCRPPGKYRLVTDGAATLNSTQGTITKGQGSWNINVTGSQLMISVDGAASAALYRVGSDGKMIAPSHGFNPDLIAMLQGARILRFMEFIRTNNSGITAWSGRSQFDGLTYSNRGAPYEDCIKLCEQVGAMGWLNIPHRVNTFDFTSQLLKLIKGSTMKFVLEYSNEVWNDIFQQSKWNFDQAQIDHKNDSDNPWYRAWIRVANQTHEIWNAIRSAGMEEQVRVVLPTQVARPEILKVMLGWLVPKWGTNWIYGAAIAPYFGNDESYHMRDGLTVDDFFAWPRSGYPQGYLLMQSWSTKSDFVKQHKAMCDSAGIKLCCYEMGLDLGNYAITGTETPGQLATKRAKIAVNSDPRIQGIVVSNLDSWFKETKGDLACWYDAADRFEKWSWGTTDHPSNQKAPKLLGIRERLGQFSEQAVIMDLKCNGSPLSNPMPSGTVTLSIWATQPVARLVLKVNDSVVGQSVNSSEVVVKIAVPEGKAVIRGEQYGVTGALISSISAEVTVVSSEVDELRKELDSVKADRDSLKADNDKLILASQQDQQTIADLRKKLDSIRGILNGI